MKEINIQQTLYNLFKKTRGKYIQKDEEEHFWYVEDVYFKNKIAKIKLRLMEGGTQKSLFLQVIYLRNMEGWSDRWVILNQKEFNKILLLKGLEDKNEL